MVRSVEGRRREAFVTVGSDAAPAALPRKQGLGRPRDPPWRHYDRCAGSRLDWDWLRWLTAAEASSQEARTWGIAGGRKTAGNAAMERRSARASRQRLVAVTGDYQDVAPTGAPSPSAMAGGRRRKTTPPRR
jgi:hypothetical protein